MITFQDKTWKLIVTRNASFFLDDMLTKKYNSSFKNFGLESGQLIYVAKDGSSTSMFNTDDTIASYSSQVEQICLNPEKFKKLEDTYYHYGDLLWQASNKLKGEASLENFTSYVEACSAMTPALAITTYIGRHMLDLLLKELEQITGNNLVESSILVGDITYPEKHTPMMESQMELLRIGKKLQNLKLSVEQLESNNDVSDDFRKYIEKFSIIPVNFTDDPWTVEEIKRQLSELLKKDCSVELDVLLDNHNSKIEKGKKIIKQLDNEKITQMANSLKVATILNEYRKFVFCHASLAYRPLFQKIADENKLASWKTCWKFNSEEIIDLHFLNNKKVLDILKTREYAGVITNEGKDGNRLLTEEELLIFIKEIETHNVSKTVSPATEIKGMIANRGKVRGTVKIISGSVDFDKFNEGDIIVATMTSVDFVPIMRKAAAFVTNEGGITCHASIISREMNKPCIIGTMVATRILKDGDMVEVDADKGVVRIIK